MSTTIVRNEQFNSFVEFAQKAMTMGNTKAVARANATVAGPNGGLASRTIKAATTDKAFAFTRSAGDKADNNITRDLFRQSVAAMFGGEGRIPDSVRKAMLLKDYDAGKPLTARRIMAVKQAIELALDPIVKVPSKEHASGAVLLAQRAVNTMHRNVQALMPHIALTREQSSQAATLVAKYGNGLSESGLGLLSNFTVNLLASLAADPNSNLDPEACVKKFAQDISKWRTFEPGDTRFVAVDAKVTEHAQSMLDEYLGGARAGQFDGDGLYQSFVRDAPSARFTINGHEYPHSPGRGGDVVVQAFKNAVPPRHRKALSAFFCQAMGNTLACFSQKSPLPPTAGMPAGMDLGGVKGAEMFMSTSPRDVFYKGQRLDVRGSSYTLDVAPDGNSARIVIETKGDIRFALNGVRDIANNLVGTFAWKQEFVFDLSTNPPKIASASVGQSIDSHFSIA